MKQNKIWCIGLFTSFIFGVNGFAQSPKTAFSFKVRKENVNAEKITAAIEKPKQSAVFIKTPRLITGEFGLMKIENYNTKLHNLQNANFQYVVFSYTVGKNGKIKNFICHQTNNLELKNVLYESLLGSDWQPALNEKNQNSDFEYPKQILITQLNFKNNENTDY